MTVKIRENDVISSLEDKRNYRGLVLSNDLKVMLISDPTTDKSAASLDIHVGCFSDPRSLPGLAHFCEHMLFMGTEKYPCENEYTKYLSENGGSSNAYTAADHTNYYFDVAPDAFLDALDRFSQFFVCPLFLEDSVDREVNAVHCEHEKNVQSDSWRLMQLERSTSNPDHDFCKFGTGNRETLSTLPKAENVNMREELLKFHRKWYSGNIMALSILGKESLDELEQYAIDLFSPIKNYDIEVPSWNDHPFRLQECRKEISVVPVMDVRNLVITFPIPDLQPYYKSAPGCYLAHLIGHEGPGSLLSYLKKRGWVSTLSGGQRSGAKGFSFFIVNVDLTEDGIKHTDDIVQNVFEYFNLIRNGGVKEWIFDECRSLNEISFRFKDKEKPMSYVCNIAGLLHNYPLAETLYGQYLMSEFDPERINWVLSMLKPENIRVTVLGKAMEEKANSKEKWYGTDYCMDEIDETKLLKWQEVGLNEDLILPPKNEFIPSNLSLYQSSLSSVEFPTLICQNDLCSIWYKLDTEFNLPKSCLYLELFNSIVYSEPLNGNLSHMLVHLYKDSFTEFAYDAKLAELYYSMNSTKYGVTISVHGYTDKQAVLLSRLITELRSFRIDEQRFDIVKENYIRLLQNFSCEQPHSHLVYYTSLILSEQGWSVDDLLSCMDNVTIKNLEEFKSKFLSNLHIEVLVHGSLSREKAEETCGIIFDQLTQKSGTKSLLPQQFKRMRECTLEAGSSFVFQTETKIHSSSGVEAFYQLGVMSTRNNMLAELLVQIIHEPAFDQLRTKEQLGYIVWCGLRRSHGTQGLRLIIQGEKHPRSLDARIEAFLHIMKSYLADMSAEDFDKHMSALAKQRLERPKKLVHLASRWWSEITSNHLNFNRDQIEVDELRTITKSQLLDFYDQFIYYEGKERRKLAVYVLSVAEGGAGHDDKGKDTAFEELEFSLQEPETIESIPSFKSSLALYPVTKPIAPLNSYLAKDSKAKL